MTSTQYNITVGHTGLARLCLEHWCYRTRTKLAEVREAPTSTGGGGCHTVFTRFLQNDEGKFRKKGMKYVTHN